MPWGETGHHLQGFLNSSKGWGIENFDGEDFLPGEGNLRRCDFSNSNLFQS